MTSDTVLKRKGMDVFSESLGLVDASRLIIPNGSKACIKIFLWKNFAAM
ncbi:MAG: hypothetical protein LBI04_00415 [Treponema sp.]|nr:hypothetical protein [Treponema sp.]